MFVRVWFELGCTGALQMRFDELVHVLSSPGFHDPAHPIDEGGFGAAKLQKILAAHQEDDSVFSRDDGWHVSEVDIPLLRTGLKTKTEAAAPTYTVKGIHHRNLMDLLRGAVRDKTSPHVHKHYFHPFEQYWHPPSQPADQSSTTHETQDPEGIRVYTDAFDSDFWIEEDLKIHELPRHPDDDDSVEYVVLPRHIWSDETQLAQFGSASLWPIYLYTGTLSQYIRARPSEYAAHHLAYLPSVCVSMETSKPVLTRITAPRRTQ